MITAFTPGQTVEKYLPRYDNATSADSTTSAESLKLKTVLAKVGEDWYSVRMWSDKAALSKYKFYFNFFGVVFVSWNGIC